MHYSKAAVAVNCHPLSYIADSTHARGIEQHKQIVAICLCVTSKAGYLLDGSIVYFPRELKNTILQKYTIPSLETTITSDEQKDFYLKLYLGIDDNDAFWLDQVAHLNAPDWLKIRPAVFKVINNKIPFNSLMRQAYNEGADYLVRVNDDTHFLTSGWISMGVHTLQGHTYPNVGVVGPTAPMDLDRTTIMTHDMVHRTHLCIFKDYYYPDVFSSWWVDDWISLVYVPGILSTKLEDWRVDHDIRLHGRRYQVQEHEEIHLANSILEGRRLIHDWLLSQHTLSQRASRLIIWRLSRSFVIRCTNMASSVRSSEGGNGPDSLLPEEGNGQQVAGSHLSESGHFQDLRLIPDARLPSDVKEIMKAVSTYTHEANWASECSGLCMCPEAFMFFISAAQRVGGTICVIGIGSGTSAVLFLMAGMARVHTFDLGDAFTRKIVAHLNVQFENRLQPHWGDPHATISESNVMCDLVFVDALHPTDIEVPLLHIAHSGTEFLYHSAGAKFLVGKYLWEDLSKSNASRNDGQRCIYHLGRIFRESAIAKGIQEQFGFVFLQVFNEAFMQLVSSWVCRAKTIPDLLNQTLFVTTDSSAERALRAMGVTNILVVPYESGHLSYGQRQYFNYMLFRSRIVQVLLDHSINVWLVEADSTWFENPTPFIRQFQDLDIVVGQDGTLTDDIPEAGFIYLNSTTLTRRIWSDLTLHHESVLKTTMKDDLGNSGSEMLLLPDHLKKVKWTYFPRTRFVGGLWYSDITFREAVNPVVIQNNWIIGNSAKIERAKKWGHWRVQKDGKTCTEIFLGGNMQQVVDSIVTESVQNLENDETPGSLFEESMSIKQSTFTTAYVISLQDVPYASKHNAGRLDAFSRDWTAKCSRQITFKVCSGVTNQDVQALQGKDFSRMGRGYGITQAYIECIETALQDRQMVSIFLEDDARLADTIFCNMHERNLLWKLRPSDTLLMLLGGHSWRPGSQDIFKHRFRWMQGSLGAYAVAVPYENLEILQQWFRDDILHGAMTNAESLSPDISWYELAVHTEKRIYSADPLLVYHNLSYSNTWGNYRDEIPAGDITKAMVF